MSQPHDKPHNRRRFLKRIASGATAAAATPYLVPGCVLGADDAVVPSERITLGSIGIGMMGQGHLGAFLRYGETQVLAVCDPDRWRRENAKTRVEQTYAARRAGGTYRGCSAHADLRS